jgi:hypothetical protein
MHIDADPIDAPIYATAMHHVSLDERVNQYACGIDSHPGMLPISVIAGK